MQVSTLASVNLYIYFCKCIFYDIWKFSNGSDCNTVAWNPWSDSPLEDQVCSTVSRGWTLVLSGICLICFTCGEYGHVVEKRRWEQGQKLQRKCRTACQHSLPTLYDCSQFMLSIPSHWIYWNITELCGWCSLQTSVFSIEHKQAGYEIRWWSFCWDFDVKWLKWDDISLLLECIMTYATVYLLYDLCYSFSNRIYVIDITEW